MSANKNNIRSTFRESVFSRDSYTCRVCGKKWSPEDASPSLKRINSHHIVDRRELPNGGYVLENGITVCDGGENSCHMKCERFHISGGTIWEPGLHPDDLYAIIGSSHELAIKMSLKLKE